MFESLRKQVDLRASTQEKTNRLQDLIRNIGLNVKFSAGFSTEASFDGTTIKVMHPEYLEKAYGLSSKDAETVAVYLTVHEASHVEFSNNDVGAALGQIQQKYTALGYNWDKLFLCIDLLEDAIVDTLMAKKHRGVSDYQEQGIKIINYTMFKGERLGHPAVGALHMYQTGDVITQADPHVAGLQQQILDLIKRTVAKNQHANKYSPPRTEAESIELYHILYGKPNTGKGEQSNNPQSKGEGEDNAEQGDGAGKSTQANSETDGDRNNEPDIQKDGDSGDTTDGGGDADDTQSDGGGTGTGEDTDAGEANTDTGGTDGDNSAQSGSNTRQVGESAEEQSDDTVAQEADCTVQTVSGGMPAIPKINFDKDFKECGDQYADDAQDFDGKEYGLHVEEYQYSKLPGARALYKQMERDVKEAKNLQVGYAKISDTRSIKTYEAEDQDEVKSGVSDLTRRIKQILEREQSDYTRGMTSGALDTRALTRLSTNNTRVFKQKTEKSTGGMAVSILLDASGSMSGSTIPVGKMAYVIAKALSNHGIATKIAYHRTSRAAGGSALLVTLKDWGEKTFGGLNHYGPDMDNRDDVSIYLSGMELAMRPEPAKLLLVLSDGRPADGVSRKRNGQMARMYGPEAIKNCNAVVQLLRRAGIATVGVFWSNSTKAEVVNSFKSAEDGSTPYYLQKVEPLKRIYGDDFMTCEYDAWKQFPAKLVRAIAHVFKT